MNETTSRKPLDLPVRNGLVWEAMRLATEGVPLEQFLEKALEAKTNIAEQAYDLWRQVAILDDLVEYLAPDVTWTKGWDLDLATGGSRTVSLLTNPRDVKQDTTSRARRVLDLANEMLEESDSVLSKEIAEKLREEGYKGNIRDLSVSAGNLLSRSEMWERVGSGEYRPIE